MEATTGSLAQFPARRLSAALGVSAALHVALLASLGHGPAPDRGQPPKLGALTVTIERTVANLPSPNALRASLPADAIRNWQKPQVPEAAVRAPLPPVAYHFSSSEVDVPAEAINDVLLRYPPEAYRQQVAGEVKLRVYIDETGFVHKVQLLEAEPSGVFETAAVDAAQQLRYSAALKAGEPVKSIKTIRIVFDPSTTPLD
ncbi:MAG: energy transducer TonB [Burkholderiales bacterium]